MFVINAFMRDLKIMKQWLIIPTVFKKDWLTYERCKLEKYLGFLEEVSQLCYFFPIPKAHRLPMALLWRLRFLPKEEWQFTFMSIGAMLFLISQMKEFIGLIKIPEINFLVTMKCRAAVIVAKSISLDCWKFNWPRNLLKHQQIIGYRRCKAE